MNKVALYIIIAALGGSAIPVAAKIGLEVFGPFTMLFFRFSLSCAVLFFLVPSNQRGFKTARSLWSISILGALNPALLFIALQFTSASIAPLIYSIIPVLIAIYSYVIKNEKLHIKQVSGLLIGLLGVTWIATLPLLKDTPDFDGFWANGLIVVAAFCVMFFGLRSKHMPAARKAKPETIIYHFSLVAFLFSIPLALQELTGDTQPILVSIELKHILAAVGVGLTSLAGYLPQQYVIKMTSTTVAFMTSYLQPIIAAVLAVILLNESIPNSFITAGVMILIGARLVQKNQQPESPSR